MEKVFKAKHYFLVILATIFILLPLSQTHSADVNFTGGWLCNGNIAITYANADDDNSTGVWVGGTWYPNETQVALYHIQGDIELSGDVFFSFIGTNCGETGWQTQKGKFVLRFIDALAPGWVWNNPSTWQEKKISRAEFRWSHDWCSNYAVYYGPYDPRNVWNQNPYFKATAYEHWRAGGNIVDSTTTAGTQTLEDTTGFSEVYFATDFCENMVQDLAIFAGTGGCPPFVTGPDACTTACPCDEGQGDCDGDNQCAPGLVCAQDVGANYGWPATRDVCEQPGGACPPFVTGPDACTTACPCDEGQGDCDGDNQCAPGLVCAQDVGANYGWPATRDVCEQPGGACPPFVTGPDACTTACPCDEGQGDCDGDNQCAPGLVCAQDVGANYGWPATRDVCEQPGGACPPFVTGPDACTTACPCDEGQGDCDGDNQCAPGLVCAQDVGANYGWPATRDVCELPGGPGDCILDSKFRLGSIRVGASLYTDRAYTITGGIPDWMVGRTLIQTPNDELNNNAASGYIRFTAPVSYWVYVLFDSRSASIPNWLSGWERYTKYPDIQTSLATQPGLKMYRKLFDAGQCVDLGGNYGPGASSETRSNYVVVYGQ